jgi:acetate kinase
MGANYAHLGKTMKYILVLNCGSSSLKFALIDPISGHEKLTGLAERLNAANARVIFKIDGNKEILELGMAGHNEAITSITEYLNTHKLSKNISAVGHRVVHGGEKFSASQIITASERIELKKLNHLAPLHNPVNILGLELATQNWPTLPQVAVFDTAFHQSQPEHAYLYGVPFEWYENMGVRRYGFHGTSYRYVAQQAADQINKPIEETALLIAHLGNGCSACAVLEGKSVDTTMGMTPLDGLVMGTRSGSLDAGLAQFLCSELELSIDQLTDQLNKKSGLLGLSGVSNDMRTLLEAANSGNDRATIAVEVFCYHAARQLMSLTASLPRVDAMVFTGGIGENSAPIRSRIMHHLAILGLKEDTELNQSNGNDSGLISQVLPTSATQALVVATNEELMIARDTATLAGLI